MIIMVEFLCRRSAFNKLLEFRRGMIALKARESILRQSGAFSFRVHSAPVITNRVSERFGA